MPIYRTHQQKKYFHQIIFYLLLLILIIIFIATIGIKLLINTTIFVAEISHRNRDYSNQKTAKTDYILPPKILELPNATNSAKIPIIIKAVSGKNLSIFLNDDLYKEATLQENFFKTDIDLTPGENSIYLILEDPQTKEKKQSVMYRLIYKNEKPKLEITSPQNQEKVSKDEIVIAGQTDKEVFVKISNLPVVVDAEGKFSSTLKLTQGENKIKIEAQDIAGNIEIKELTVIYQKED